MRLFVVLFMVCYSASLLAADCGAENQRPCKVWERIPSCDQWLTERHGRCISVHDENYSSSRRPDWCGHRDQRPCRVDEFIPSCEGSLVERDGKCMSLDCGGAGQRPCNVGESNAVLKPDDSLTPGLMGGCNYGQALNPSTRQCDDWWKVCGDVGLPPCEREYETSYRKTYNGCLGGTKHNAQNTMCIADDCPSGYAPDAQRGFCTTCGVENMPPCPSQGAGQVQYTCNAGLSIENQRCVSRTQTPPSTFSGCGTLNQRPCRVYVRVPSCDTGLREDFMKDICVQ